MWSTISSTLDSLRIAGIFLYGYYRHLLSTINPFFILAVLLYIIILSSLMYGFTALFFRVIRGIKTKASPAQTDRQSIAASVPFGLPLKGKRIIAVFLSVILLGLLTLSISKYLSYPAKTVTIARVLWLNLFFQIAVIGTVLTVVPPHVLHFSLPQGFFRKSLAFFSAVINVFIVALAVNGIVTHLLHIQPSYQPIIALLLKEEHKGILALAGIEAVLLGPLAEELVFRGVLFRTLRSWFSLFPAILSSSILFSLLHHTPYIFLPLACIGAVFAYAYEKTKNLLYPVALHMCYNALILLFIVVVRNVRY